MEIHRFLPLGAALLSSLGTASLAAQAAEEGGLVLRVGEREVGGETYRVVHITGGLRITSKTVFTGTRPAPEFTVSSERSDSGSLAFQLAYRDSGSAGEVYAVQQRNRLTIRRVERSSERASELPAPRRVVLLADSTFAPFIQLVPLAGEDPQPVVGLYPRSGRRVNLTVQRRALPDRSGTVVQVSGDLVGEIRLGNRDELLGISFPGFGMEAVRRRD